jgi:hypothetical protein
MKAAARASSRCTRLVLLENFDFLVMGRVMRELRTEMGDPVIDKARSVNKHAAENMACWKVVSYSVAHYICASERDGNVWEPWSPSKKR